MSSTTPYPVNPGPAVPVQIAGSPPAGMTLVNPGDNGGTVWVAAGPNGPQLPLTPGGTLEWADHATFPYLSLAAGVTAPETVMVTDQAANYSNPEAVAAATATQLAAQGIPSTFLGSVVYSAAMAPGGTAVLDVSKYASLIVAVQWYDQTGTKPAAMKLEWSSGAGFSTTKWVSHDPTWEATRECWRSPVYGPTLTLSNYGLLAQQVTIYGTNRPTDRFEILGDRASSMLGAATPGQGIFYDLFAQVGGGPPPAPALTAGNFSRLTRFTGLVSVTYAVGATSTANAVSLIASWVDPNAGNPVRTSHYVSMNGGVNTTFLWNHPPVPVAWVAQPGFAIAGGTVRIMVTGGDAT